MGIHGAGVRHTLDFLADLQLIPESDRRRMQWLFEPEFPFRTQLEAADSLHVHVKVADTSTLPDDAIVNAGGQPENRQTGYVKYAFPAGVNVIFSSIPVAEEDRLPGTPRIAGPVLDHVGFDLRKESTAVRQRFDAVPDVAAHNGWRTIGQGGGDRAVFCCHTQVNEKRWAYPPSGLAAWTRPLEFAFGPLVISEASMGCDLRPIDPAHPRAREASGCCAGSDCAPQSQGTSVATNGGGESTAVVHSGQDAARTTAKFWDYFNAATSEAGALSTREKALIALAVAHAKQCATCIDSFTAKCLQSGSNADEMREATHVAVAMSAGIETMRSGQMQDAAHATADPA